MLNVKPGCGYGCPGWCPLAAMESCPAPQVINRVRVLQVNLNKSNSAQLELSVQLRKERDFICLLTEPATIRNRLSGIPKSYNVLPEDRSNSPRAAIYTSKTVEIHEIASLRHRDLVVGIVKIGGKITAIISAYMDIKNNPITEQLTAAVDYCKNKGYGILLGTDTNSHSKLWGNATNTKEGRNGSNSWKKKNCCCITRVEYQLMKVS